LCDIRISNVANSLYSRDLFRLRTPRFTEIHEGMNGMTPENFEPVEVLRYRN